MWRISLKVSSWYIRTAPLHVVRQCAEERLQVLDWYLISIFQAHHLLNHRITNRSEAEVLCMLRRCRVLQVRTICEVVGMPEEFKIAQSIKRSARGSFRSKSEVQRIQWWSCFCLCKVSHFLRQVALDMCSIPWEGKRRCELQPCCFSFNIQQSVYSSYQA